MIIMTLLNLLRYIYMEMNVFVVLEYIMVFWFNSFMSLVKQGGILKTNWLN